jgi:Ca2+-binding RTX toxin-like protein
MKGGTMRGIIAGAALALALTGGAALAASVDVHHGTPGDDRIGGGNGSDLVYGYGGDDVLGGGKGPDELRGGMGDDVLWTGKGGATSDAAYGGPGDDRLFNYGSGQTSGTTDGGPGFDRCTVNAGEETISCEVVNEGGA